MTTRTIRRVAGVGIAALTPLLLAGVASAHPNDHVGDPAVWGPTLASICTGGGSVAGYNVINGDNFANVIVGTPGPDVIFAFDGNDEVRGGPGRDVLCLGNGADKGRGGRGNDAVFAESGDDILIGDKHRDFLDGGTQVDDCDGGDHDDAAVQCETVASVP